MNSGQTQARQLILVTGPARSGKSQWAEALASRMNCPVTYLATARQDETDAEWQARLQQHRRRRPSHWQTREVPTALAEAIEQAVPPHCLLVDSLGTWVANLLAQEEETWQETVSQLLAGLVRAPVSLILVAEEVGWGVVPAYPAGRQFRDRLGSLSRQVGGIASTTYLVTGGYALNLSQLGRQLEL